MTWSELRAAVNSPRAHVVAIVGGLSAFGGTVAGGVAALIAAAVLTPSEPVSAAQIAWMAIGYGFVAGLAGCVLGLISAFGALRRVPLGRLILCTNAGLAAGLIVGWLGGPWAWHHFGALGFTGFAVGALLARVGSRGSPVPNARRLYDSVPANGTIPSEPHGVVPTLTSPSEWVTPTDRIADRVRRSIPPEP